MSFSDMSEDEIVKIADQIWDNIQEGSNSRDYGVFSSRFAKNMLEAVPVEEFNRQCDTIPILTGLETSRTYLGLLRREPYVRVLWKQLGKGIEGEFLALLTLGYENNEIRVFGAQIK